MGITEHFDAGKNASSEKLNTLNYNEMTEVRGRFGEKARGHNNYLELP